jgi:hypothetical protein
LPGAGCCSGRAPEAACATSSMATASSGATDARAGVAGVRPGLLPSTIETLCRHSWRAANIGLLPVAVLSLPAARDCPNCQRASGGAALGPARH